MGVELLGPAEIRVVEHDTPNPRFIEACVDKGAEMPVLPGRLTISAEVSVTYRYA